MNKTLAALPLNPDEEADYRWFYGPILPPNPEPTGADTVIARLFATLDAERAYRADLATKVRALTVRDRAAGENDWQQGFRQSRNETVAAVLALIEGEPR